MSVGQIKQNTLYNKTLDNRTRKFAVGANIPQRLEITNHLTSYTIPENGLTFNDVLVIKFYSDATNATTMNNTLEKYWLANGYGTIRFTSNNSGDPAGVQLQYATSSAMYTQTATPKEPWFDPFQTVTNFPGFQSTAYAPNGFFNDLYSAVNGGTVSSCLKFWTGSSADCVITTDAPAPNGSPWTVCLRGSASGGDAATDVVSTSWIPANPGATYRISGYVFRSSAADNTYIDLSDGIGYGQNFPDAQAGTTVVGA